MEVISQFWDFIINSVGNLASIMTWLTEFKIPILNVSALGLFTSYFIAMLIVVHVVKLFA